MSITANMVVKPPLWVPGRNLGAWDLWQGCVGYWPLWEGGQFPDRVDDLSYNNTTGIRGIGAAAPNWAVHAPGWCVEFDGGDHITIGDVGVPWHAQNQSMSAFVYMQTTADGADNYIFGTDLNTGWYARVNHSTGDDLLIKIDDGAEDEFTNGGPALNDGVWHLVGFTLEAGGAFLGYVDGLKVITLTAGSVDALATTLLLGSIGAPPNFTGLIALCCLWDRALKPVEVATLAADPFIMTRPPVWSPLWVGAQGGAAGAAGLLLKETELGNSLLRGLIHAG